VDSLRRVESLADHLLEFADIRRPPVPLSLVYAVADVRLMYVDWRYHQGFIMQRNGVFYIAINGNDADGEQRFTVFHELFHVIERVQPAFHQAAVADWHAELLADHFAMSILLNDRWFAAYTRACDSDLGAVATDCGASVAAVERKLASIHRGG
jgi:Zn-dependent peptidase ImmA (M78 family)